MSNLKNMLSDLYRLTGDKIYLKNNLSAYILADKKLNSIADEFADKRKRVEELWNGSFLPLMQFVEQWLSAAHTSLGENQYSKEKQRAMEGLVKNLTVEIKGQSAANSKINLLSAFASYVRVFSLLSSGKSKNRSGTFFATIFMLQGFIPNILNEIIDPNTFNDPLKTMECLLNSYDFFLPYENLPYTKKTMIFSTQASLLSVIPTITATIINYIPSFFAQMKESFERHLRLDLCFSTEIIFRLHHLVTDSPSFQSQLGNNYQGLKDALAAFIAYYINEYQKSNEQYDFIRQARLVQADYYISHLSSMIDTVSTLIEGLQALEQEKAQVRNQLLEANSFPEIEDDCFSDISCSASDITQHTTMTVSSDSYGDVSKNDKLSTWLPPLFLFNIFGMQTLLSTIRRTEATFAKRREFFETVAFSLLHYNQALHFHPTSHSLSLHPESSEEYQATMTFYDKLRDDKINGASVTNFHIHYYSCYRINLMLSQPIFNDVLPQDILDSLKREFELVRKKKKPDGKQTHFPATDWGKTLKQRVLERFPALLSPQKSKKKRPLSQAADSPSKKMKFANNPIRVISAANQNSNTVTDEPKPS